MARGYEGKMPFRGKKKNRQRNPCKHKSSFGDNDSGLLTSKWPIYPTRFPQSGGSALSASSWICFSALLIHDRLIWGSPSRGAEAQNGASKIHRLHLRYHTCNLIRTRNVGRCSCRTAGQDKVILPIIHLWHVNMNWGVGVDGLVGKDLLASINTSNLVAVSDKYRA